MFLKHRNSIALILILLAALSWTLGQQLLQSTAEDGNIETMYTVVYETTVHPTTVHPTSNTLPSTEATTNPGSPMEEAEEQPDEGKFLRFGLSFLAVLLAGIAIFAFVPKEPLPGPDGIALIAAIYALIPISLGNMEYIVFDSVLRFWDAIHQFIIVTLFLLAVREYWGWVWAKAPLSWCLVRRLSLCRKSPQGSLLTMAVWILLASTGILYLLFQYQRLWLPLCCFLTAGVFGLVCLWKYGSDLNHFQKQLRNYQQGFPIRVGNGAFAQTEAQLLVVQAQHEEAIRRVVTSERFKVELISNVSHDLRTPLTSILGYSELLQQEQLSPEGQEQLRRLHLKAGYMNDLVESLFELTKVSSGVVESKKEDIDLVRLLEQTIGLFDDQLNHAGLLVRRSYQADSIPIITDGARMHQVFANLLGNAIKYALPGTRIYLEVKETGNSCLIRMMNTASYEMDFKPEEIMQRFARGDKARSTKGSGLGLAIAQTYTESVGGSFRVSVDGDQFSAIVELPKTERNL